MVHTFSTSVGTLLQPDPDPPHDTVMQDEIEDKIEFHSTTSYSHRATLLQDLDTCDVYSENGGQAWIEPNTTVIHKVSTSVANLLQPDPDPHDCFDVHNEDVASHASKNECSDNPIKSFGCPTSTMHVMSSRDLTIDLAGSGKLTEPDEMVKELFPDDKTSHGEHLSDFATKTYKHIDEDKIENKLEEDYVVPMYCFSLS